MTTVKEIALQYRARGAQEAVQADRNVRDSIQRTADTARQERGEINRWMERNQRALQTIGVATAAAMGAIITASPTMRAEMAGVRTAFSLFADTVIRDVLPQGSSLTSLAFDLQEAYNGLPGPVRKVTSGLILFGGIATSIVATVGGLSQLISGTLVASALKSLGSAIAGLVSGSVTLAAAIGGLLGLFGVWVLEVTGVLGAVQNLGATVSGPTTDKLLALASVLTLGLLPAFATVGAAIVGFIRDGPEGAVDAAKQSFDTFVGAVGRTASDIESVFSSAANSAIQWGEDIIDNLVQGIRNKINESASAAQEIRSAIEKKISFDQVANDRAARRWGQDLIGEMTSGAKAVLPQLESTLTVPDPSLGSGSGGSGGGGDTIVRFEEGAIRVDGGGSPGRTAERTAEEISKAFGDNVGNRGVHRR
jgi:hypothetical protein